MRLAYLDPHPVPGTTPSTMQMLQTVDGLGQIGVQVTLITPESKLAPEAVLGRALSPNVRVSHVFDPRKKWFFPFSTHKPFFWQAKRVLQNGQFDAVLVRNLKLADYLLRQGLKTPVYFETHEIFAQSFVEEHPQLSGSVRGKYAALKEREAFVYRNACGVFALTSLLVEDIVNDYGANPERLAVLPDGFDPELAELARQRAESRLRRPGPVRVLYLGSLHPWKGVGTLVDAMAHVPEAELVIAGGETHRIDELTARAKMLGIEQRVHFLGKVSPVERFDVIADADICALPLTNTSIASRYTSPLKLFEYMAMGKAIVSADLPSLREVVKDMESALLCDVSDPVSFAAAIRCLCLDPALQFRLGRAASTLAAAYAWSARAERIAGRIGNDV